MGLGIMPSGAVRPAWLVQMKYGERTIAVVLDPDDAARNDPKRYEALSFCGPIVAIDAGNIHELTRNLRRQLHSERTDK